MRRGLEIGFLLDRQWYWMLGGMDQTKQPTLMAVARAFAEAQVPYAVIGGVAMQVHQEEPRTTLDIDLVVHARDRIPHAALMAAGLRRTGVHEHSENWESGDGTPVQITDDPELAQGIERAIVCQLGNLPLWVLGTADLMQAKLRGAADSSRRRAERLLDLADAAALLESDPTLHQQLTPAQRALLGRLPN